MKKIFLLVLLVLSTGSIFSQIPDPPTLISPLNGAVNVSLFPVFQWQASSGATSYRLQISNGPTTVFDQSGITGTSYVLTATVLTGYTSYSWRMNATNASGTSSWSASWNFTTGISPPSAPNLMIPPNGAVVPINVTLNWSPVPGATGYILHVSKSPLFDSLVVCDTTPIAPITLEYNTTYYWRVCAMNLGGIGPWSSVWHFTTMGQVPDPPVLLSPPDSSVVPVTNVTFDWSDVPGATSYRIQISTSSNFGTTFVNQTTTASQYTHIAPSFSYNTLYYWRVNASNVSGTGQWSGVRKIVTTIAPPPAPTVYPVNRGKPVYADSSTIFEWHKVNTATSYRLQIITGSITVIDTVLTDTIYIAPPYTFNSGTIYYFRIASINNGGQGNWSSIFSFNVMPALPNPPTLIYPPNNSVNIPLTPTLDWTDVPGATSYRVSISTSPQFDTIVVLSMLAIPPGKLNYYTTYYWRVASINIGGQGTWSGLCNFRTINSIGIKQLSSEIPSEYKLYNNYPNPFNPSTNTKLQKTV